MGKDTQRYLLVILCIGSILHLEATHMLKVDGSFSHWQSYAVKHRDPFIVSVVKDMGLIVKNIFDWDSYKIVTATFPFLAMSRMMDDKLQSCFYDNHRYKNIHQLPHWTHSAAEICTFVPVGALASLMLVGPTNDMRTAGRVFVAGLPFVWLGKDLIKQCKTGINLRPWNEHYSRHHRAYGGFPSGHISASIYMTLFFGLRYGPKFSVPLGLCSAFIGATYLSSNRHYLSQLVGGAAFGAIWAYAARKVVDHDMEKDYNFNLSLNAQGGIDLQVAYRF